MIRQLDNFLFTYDFDRTNIKVGIKENEMLNNKLKNISIDKNELEDGWVCRKIFKFKDINTVEEIESLMASIEKDVFDINNSSSLINKILTEEK